MDLNAPLGITPPPERKRGLVVALSLGAMLLVVGASAIFVAVSDPRDGEPSAFATIPPVVSARTDGGLAVAGISAIPPSLGVGTVDRTPTASVPHDGHRSIPGRNAEEATIENGVKVFRAGPAAVPSAAETRGPLIIDVSRALDDPHRTSKVAAAPPDAIKTPAPNSSSPRIAIFVSGMGLNDAVTRTAIELMPSAVTFAFLPASAGVAASVEAAKARGHEILLQLPMRNNAADRMPHTLDVSQPPAVLDENMAWLMGRFEGYDGIVNLLGAPVSADQAVMGTILRTVHDHHLFYLDDGTSRKSVAPTVASGLGMRALTSDMVLDATADASIVKANLEALAAIARRKGSAIGMASGLPDHLVAIAEFASGLQAQGIMLVPVSALAEAATTTTTAR